MSYLQILISDILISNNLGMLNLIIPLHQKASETHDFFDDKITDTLLRPFLRGGLPFFKFSRFLRQCPSHTLLWPLQRVPHDSSKEVHILPDHNFSLMWKRHVRVFNLGHTWYRPYSNRMVKRWFLKKIYTKQ